ncbi:MAG: hypothetical protein L3K14_09240 [Thermoplasmata archaeon]|nr:hypothetical protein [Thermoplasmata archaeon]
MVNETDADWIQREKDRRRAEERLRIEREHHRRLHDVETLRRTATHPGSEGRDRPSPPTQRSAAPNPDSREEAPTGSRTPVPAQAASRPEETKETPPRPIGRRITSQSLQSFLALDPAERFDIQALNQLSVSPLLPEGEGDSELFALLAGRAEALMQRVKREVDDPLSASALLRELGLVWYRRSPDDPAWAEQMPNRWGGIFAESKISGGRLRPWLNLRLWSLHQSSIRQGRMRERVRRGLSRSRTADNAVSRTVTQQIQAEVAQALLDDLASRPRKADAPFPLIRLSELAVRRQVATVTDALATLFSASESGPFVLLHPNRYPDCEELQIRPPSGGTSGAALAFTLVALKTRRSGALPSALLDALGVAVSGGAQPAASGQGDPIDLDAIWQVKTLSETTWRAILDESRREKRRLDPPPRDYRSRAPYSTLRELLLRDAEVRKAFLAVKWRGRPAGLPLLTALLQKGMIAPEVSTDHEYIEAELGELSQGDPQYVPEGGIWKFPGWTVTREGTHAEGFRYRAVPDPAGPP